MKAPIRVLETAGVTAEDVAARVVSALASGLVLLHRKVAAGLGIEGRKLAQTWIIVRPVIESGIITRLVEDETTDRVNKVGRLRYGLRPADIDRKSLRLVAPDVYWFGAQGWESAREKGIAVVDLWDAVRPAAINREPEYNGKPGRDIGPGTDPRKAIDTIARGDGEAVAAMLEGLHLVDVADVVQSASRSERRVWRPLRPIFGDDGRPEGYWEDTRVARYTSNSGRTGFSSKTFAALSPLLVDTGYKPQDRTFGRSYCIDPIWAETAREAIGWTPEIGEDPPAARAAARTAISVPTAVRDDETSSIAVMPDEQEVVPPLDPSEREKAILAMLDGKTFQAQGPDPSYDEVARTIVRHAGPPERCQALIAAAMSKTAAASAQKQIRQSARSWWKR